MDNYLFGGADKIGDFSGGIQSWREDVLHKTVAARIRQFLKPNNVLTLFRIKFQKCVCVRSKFWEILNKPSKCAQFFLNCAKVTKFGQFWLHWSIGKRDKLCVYVWEREREREWNNGKMNELTRIFLLKNKNIKWIWENKAGKHYRLANKIHWRKIVLFL